MEIVNICDEIAEIKIRLARNMGKLTYNVKRICAFLWITHKNKIKIKIFPFNESVLLPKVMQKLLSS